MALIFDHALSLRRCQAESDAQLRPCLSSLVLSTFHQRTTRHGLSLTVTRVLPKPRICSLFDTR